MRSAAEKSRASRVAGAGSRRRSRFDRDADVYDAAETRIIKGDEERVNRPSGASLHRQFNRRPRRALIRTVHEHSLRRSSQETKTGARSSGSCFNSAKHFSAESLHAVEFRFHSGLAMSNEKYARLPIPAASFSYRESCD